MRIDDAREVVDKFVLSIIHRNGGKIEDWRLECMLFLISRGIPQLDQALHALEISFPFVDEQKYLNREVLKEYEIRNSR